MHHASYRNSTLLTVAAALTGGCGSDALGPPLPTGGTVQITATTSGAIPDPDGYTVWVDNRSPLPLAPGATATAPGLAPGPHMVELGGVASHCTVAGDNPRRVTVAAGETASVAFAVACGTPAGSVEVEVTTVGTGLDPDGYTVRLDSVRDQVVGVNGSVSFAAVVDGPHLVTLEAAIPFCRPDDNPRSVLVSGSLVRVAFQVTCRSAPAGRLLAWGAVGDSPAIFSLRADGSDVMNLTPHRAAESGRWSPDGTRVVFESQGNVFVMNSDGSNQTQLTTDGGHTPAWSSDGSRIVYANHGLVVMEADGSNPVALTSGVDGYPGWSPDGSRIAFNRTNPQLCRTNPFSNTLCTIDLYTVRPDGTQLTALTSNPAGIGAIQAAWSPDGTRIAFAHSTIVTYLVFQKASWDLWVMGADGSGAIDLTNSAGVDERAPVWSPDGAWIAYSSSDRGAPLRLAIGDATGAPAAVFSNPGLESPSAWR